MRSENDIVRERQLAIRREMDRRGISLKAVALDAGMSYSTVQSYFPADPHAQPAVMSVAAGFRLLASGALPLDLLSLLLPEGFALVKVPSGIDHDELAEAFADYLTTKNAAHHPDSPAGRDIADCERDALDDKVVRLPLGRVA